MTLGAAYRDRYATDAKPQRPFHAYVDAVKPRYQWYRHCVTLAEALQGVADGTITRLMVFEPPRHGKSEEVSRLFTGYYLERHPERWVGLAAYAAGLAFTLSRNARDNYVHAGNALNEGAAGVEHWETAAGGGMWAAGVGGPITGKGAHLLIVDDPVKNDEEAQSETIREKHKDWWRSTFYTRAEPNAAIIVVQTRWHEDDLSGWLLAEESADDGETAEGWHILNLPAIAEPEAPKFPPTCVILPDWRQPGEPLCPERYTLARLTKIAKKVGSRVWEALFQQRPSAAAGVVFKRKWWKFYTTPDRPDLLDEDVVMLPAKGRDILSWDMSFKDTDGTDYVSGQAWRRLNDRFYLLDRVKERMSFTAACTAVMGMAGKWPTARGKYVEDKANGAAIIDKLRRTIPGLVPVEPDGGKIARAYAVQPLAEAGNVYLPHPLIAPWVEDYIRELAAFPNGVNDDDVDATTQALNVLDPGARAVPIHEPAVDPHDPRIMAEQGNPSLGTVRKLMQRHDLTRRLKSL
jgi:predicted phage terminase large subunit-like protein